MKKYLIGALVLIAVIVMVKTVPDKKVHKKVMMEAVKEYVDEEAANLGLGDDVLSNLGKGIVNKTVEVALNSKLVDRLPTFVPYCHWDFEQQPPMYQKISL